MEGPLTVSTKLKERLANFRTAVPVVEALASASVRDWHWADISDILNAPVNPEDGLTLQKLLDLVSHGGVWVEVEEEVEGEGENPTQRSVSVQHTYVVLFDFYLALLLPQGAVRHLEAIQSISLVAHKQSGLEKALASMRKEWQNVVFELVTYKVRTVLAPWVLPWACQHMCVCSALGSCTLPCPRATAHALYLPASVPPATPPSPNPNPNPNLRHLTFTSYLTPTPPHPTTQDTGVSIVRGVETVYALIDDHLVKIQMILSSPYVTHIERQCRAWEQKLLDATSLLESWMACQRSWLYLEPIFGSKEILRQMPKEGRKFAAVDALWRRTMQGVEEERKVMDCIENSSLYTTFDIANAKLEEVQKGLNEYVAVAVWLSGCLAVWLLDCLAV
jgi:hypothetical protein